MQWWRIHLPIWMTLCAFYYAGGFIDPIPRAEPNWFVVTFAGSLATVGLGIWLAARRRQLIGHQMSSVVVNFALCLTYAIAWLGLEFLGNVNEPVLLAAAGWISGGIVFFGWPLWLIWSLIDSVRMLREERLRRSTAVAN